MNNVLGRISAFTQSQLLRLRREDEGATAVEYGLIIALISVAVIGGAILLGTTINGTFTKVANDVASPHA
jgi:pilus assembly protein Flp/PilA